MSEENPTPESQPAEPIPVVSLVYHPTRGQATPGVLANFKVDLDIYHRAYTAKLEGLREFEARYKTEHPDASEEDILAAGNDFLSGRMNELESIMAQQKLEWVVSWRVQEERLKIASENERTRIRKKDLAYRSKVEGTDTVRKPRGKTAVTRVPTDPAEKRKVAKQLLMSRMGLTEQEAEDRLRIMEDMRAAAAPPPPPTVKIEAEPEENQ